MSETAVVVVCSVLHIHINQNPESQKSTNTQKQSCITLFPSCAGTHSHALWELYYLRVKTHRLQKLVYHEKMLQTQFNLRNHKPTTTKHNQMVHVFIILTTALKISPHIHKPQAKKSIYQYNNTWRHTQMLCKSSYKAGSRSIIVPAFFVCRHILT